MKSSIFTLVTLALHATAPVTAAPCGPLDITVTIKSGDQVATFPGADKPEPPLLDGTPGSPSAEPLDTPPSSPADSSDAYGDEKYDSDASGLDDTLGAGDDLKFGGDAPSPTTDDKKPKGANPNLPAPSSSAPPSAGDYDSGIDGSDADFAEGMAGKYGPPPPSSSSPAPKPPSLERRLLPSTGGDSAQGYQSQGHQTPDQGFGKNSGADLLSVPSGNPDQTGAPGPISETKSKYPAYNDDSQSQFGAGSYGIDAAYGQRKQSAGQGQDTGSYSPKSSKYMDNVQFDDEGYEEEDNMGYSSSGSDKYGGNAGGYPKNGPSAFKGQDYYGSQKQSPNPQAGAYDDLSSQMAQTNLNTHTQDPYGSQGGQGGQTSGKGGSQAY
ncbi:hypothetical protein BDV25DRAFT_137567 [Aspergillus avenaceus]|uniref:Uncharacterized protein n=1 Tax=Aspergillus avenaceus TaxID=36643 RepID=A0A5N6U2W4_ASPAV|nr:hypothetical protein BDV25DRAFT_137567 [Aspergillus avenaceus]